MRLQVALPLAASLHKYARAFYIQIPMTVSLPQKQYACHLFPQEAIACLWVLIYIDTLTLFCILLSSTYVYSCGFIKFCFDAVE